MLESNTPSFRGNINFNAPHAPMGAYFNLTCGHFGTRGGLSLHGVRPGGQDLFIGYKQGGAAGDSPLFCLPFYEAATSPPAAGATDGAASKGRRRAGVLPLRADQVERRYGWASDRWVSGPMTFTIYSPFGGIVDPTESHPAMSRVCLMPAVVASLTLDNTHGNTPRTGVFAIKFHDLSGVHVLCDQHGWRGKERVGFGIGRGLGFQATLETEGGDRAAALQPFLRHDVEEGLASIGVNPIHHVGDCAGITFEVPPGARRTLLLAFGAYLDGTITNRLEAKYYYARHFSGLLDVLDHALRGFDAIRSGSAELDRELLDSKLTLDQQFLIAHATRAYYANTQLLDVAGQPLWVVNDGERGLMNSLDLAADHVFWELKQNPWVVRNVLDAYVRHYSYQDQVKVGADGQSAAPGEEYELAPGGISFCHDMGVRNCFAPFGSSAYELAHSTGPFAYTTQEQLCNWLLIAASYVAKTGDVRWLQRQREVIYACFRSMQNRELAPQAAALAAMALAHDGATEEETGGAATAAAVISAPGMLPGAAPGHGGSASARSAQVSGALRFESARSGSGGGETTTYDSLDCALSQAREGLYLGVKRVAAYLGLEFLFSRLGDSGAEEAAANGAHVAADALARRMDHHGGTLPAVLDPANPGAGSRILPAVEALLFPWYWGTCEYGSEYKSSRTWLGNGNESFVSKLKRHAQSLLSDPDQRNQFVDGGLKLSSTSDTTWPSKVALFQYVAREVFNLGEEPRVADVLRRCDGAHVRWLIEGAGYWGYTDQFTNGVPDAHRGCPRGITSTLWMDKVRT